MKTYTIQRLVYLADHTEIGAGLLESPDLLVRISVKEWLHLPPNMCDAILYLSCKDGGPGIIKLAVLIPGIQARRLHRLAQSSDVALVMFLRGEHLQLLYEKLRI